jgi:hypothetical protein
MNKLKDPAVGQAGPLGPTFSPFKNAATLPSFRR